VISARDRYALLLAAGQLRGPMTTPCSESDPLEHRLHLGPLRSPPGEAERQRDILPHGQGRQEVESLEHEADPLASQPRERHLTKPAKVLAVEDDRAGGQPIQPGGKVQQRALARPGRAHDRREPSPVEPERDTVSATTP
jgi:hypothetical protein